MAQSIIDYGTGRAEFDPGALLNLNRIPFRVYRSDLRTAMLQHFQQLLPDRPARKRRPPYITVVSKFERHTIFSEASVSTAAIFPLQIVELLYANLTGQTHSTPAPKCRFSS